MPALPSLISMMTQLIASPSISCSQAHWDQSNKGVIPLPEMTYRNVIFIINQPTIAQSRKKNGDKITIKR